MTAMLRSWSAALILAAALVLVSGMGCAPNRPQIGTYTVDTGQVTCPVYEGCGVRPDIYTEYKGRKIYFCCDLSKREFEAHPERYIGKVPPPKAPPAPPSTSKPEKPVEKP